MHRGIKRFLTNAEGSELRSLTRSEDFDIKIKLIRLVYEYSQTMRWIEWSMKSFEKLC